MNLGLKIKTIREDNNLTQSEFGDKINISKATISKYESNKVEPSFSILEKISYEFNIPMSYFVLEDISNTNFLSKLEKNILNDFNKLNEIGKNEALKRVHELTLIPSYSGSQPEITTIAAHNDNLDDPEEIEKINSDIEEMTKW